MVLPQRWTVDEYRRMSDVGLLKPDQRTELIDGQILRIPPQHPSHFRPLLKSNTFLQRLVTDTHQVGVRIPFRIGDWHAPEPDLCLVPLEQMAATPGGELPTPDLIVEISDGSLEYDRRTKFSLYASGDVPEYWIVNLRERQLEVFRSPDRMPGTVYGHGYRELRVYTEGDAVHPLTRPDITVHGSDLME